MASASSNTATIDPYAPFPAVKGQRLKFTSTAPFTPSFIQEHTRINARSYTTRVQGRQILLENPAKESRIKKEREAKRARQERDAVRTKAGILNRNEAKRLGVWIPDKKNLRYITFLPLHHLWWSYMAELMNCGPLPADPALHPPRLPNSASLHTKLVKADFHGCIIRVSQSRNPSLVGCEGIVIHETENTFKIITLKNAHKVIPKQNSIFTFSIPLFKPPPFDLSSLTPPLPSPSSSPAESVPLNPTSTESSHPTSHPNLPPAAVSTSTSVPIPPDLQPRFLTEPAIQFELYGNQFCFRSADRASRKFKAKETIEL